MLAEIEEIFKIENGEKSAKPIQDGAVKEDDPVNESQAVVDPSTTTTTFTTKLESAVPTTEMLAVDITKEGLAVIETETQMYKSKMKFLGPMSKDVEGMTIFFQRAIHKNLKDKLQGKIFGNHEKSYLNLYSLLWIKNMEKKG